MESRTVVITHFDAQVEKYNVIHYSIGVTFTDNPQGSSGGGISFDSMISADMGSATATTSGIAASGSFDDGGAQA
jgi:hypothetical protein